MKVNNAVNFFEIRLLMIESGPMEEVLPGTIDAPARAVI